MIRYIPDPDEGPDPSPFASRWLQSAGGAELNVTVALARLGWPGHLARWVSVVPRGALGDHFLSLLAQAYPDGKGEGNLSMVRREEGDVGIYHVWPAKHKLWYQRHRSAFGLMDPAWFGAAFWAEILQEPAPGGGPAVLQLTGITAQITQSTRAAWQNALAAAAAHKRAGWRVVTVLDINHRPALGPWEDLWALIEPHTSALDLLVLSAGDLANLEARFQMPAPPEPAEAGLAGTGLLDASLQDRLRAVGARLGGAGSLALTCKVREPGPAPALQLRWSMVCLPDGAVVSSLPWAVRQRPVEEIGGGDSWLSGTMDGLVGSTGPASEAPRWGAGTWLGAIRQGDMLATLKQKVVGDFCNVERGELDAALRAHAADPGAEV